MAGTYISIWSGFGDYWGDAVDTVGDLPSTGLDGKVVLVRADMSLRGWDGSAWVVVASGGGGGGGDVTGPGASTDNALVRWNGTAGTDVQDSPATLSDAGTLYVPSAVVGLAGSTGSAGWGAEPWGEFPWGSATAGAAFEVNSTTGTCLLPRMTTTERNALAAAPDGSLIYNTTVGKVQAREAGVWANVT